MNSLLITGGAGFIGANFVHHWCANRPTSAVVVLDALTYAGNRKSLEGLEQSGQIRFIAGDINDQALVEETLRAHSVDTLVHFAAESHVDRSIVGPDAFIETNVLGTHALLKACRRVWIEEARQPRHRFHHISTDEVFGSLGEDDVPFTESTPYAPNSPYAASKAASDHLVRAYHRTYGLSVTTTNCSNNYGPFQFPEKLIPLVIVNTLDGRFIPVYGDGRNVRDWLFVHDHCRAIESVLENGRAGETYNIGGGTEVRNLDLVRMLCRIVDARFSEDPGLAERFPRCPAVSADRTETLIQFVTDRPGHDLRYAIDGRKLESETGFRPAVPLEPGLIATVRWYLDNEPWWRQVMDGSYRAWVDGHYRSAG